MDDRRARNQALFVGECQPTTQLQRSHRHGQPGEANNSVDNNVGGLDEIGEIVDNFGERQSSGDLSAPSRIGDGHNLRPKLECLTQERSDGAADAKSDYLIAIAFRTNNVKCLLANRPGRTGDSNADSYLVTQGCMLTSR